MGAQIRFGSEPYQGKDPDDTLRHELSHGFLINRGMTPTDPYKMNELEGLLPDKAGNWEENEYDAVRTENIVNEKKPGNPLRKTYGGKDVPNPESKNALIYKLPKDGYPKKQPAPESSAKRDQ